MILTKLIIVFNFILFIKANNNCENLATLIYDDLNCEPRLGLDGCPSSYDCSDRRPKEGSCSTYEYYYNASRDLKSVRGVFGCNIGCFCTEERGNKFKITCATMDCFSDSYFSQFEDAVTCENGGITYKEGERFFPKDSCVSCICGRGYTGVYSKPLCTRLKCDLLIRNPEKIDANCAPAFYKNEIKCCPNTFICPEESVVENLESAKKDSAFKCMFGTREFNVHDKFTLKYDGSRNASCSCTIPPLLTCELS